MPSLNKNLQKGVCSSLSVQNTELARASGNRILSFTHRFPRFPVQKLRVETFFLYISYKGTVAAALVYESRVVQGPGQWCLGQFHRQKFPCSVSSLLSRVRVKAADTWASRVECWGACICHTPACEAIVD